MEADGIDALEAYRRILSWSGQRVAGTGLAQFALSTPCSEWNVEDLLEHLYATITYYTLLAEDAEVDHKTMSVAPVNDGKHGETYRAASERALRAWEQPGVLERPCHHAIVGNVPGSFALSMHAGDNLIHGWDLAIATGQDDRMDPDCARFALDTFQQVLPRQGSRGKHFASAIVTGEDADVQTRLLAFTGRVVPGKGQFR